MFSNYLSFLALGAITFATTKAQGRGDATAVSACQGFKGGEMICVSFLFLHTYTLSHTYLSLHTHSSYHLMVR